MSQTTSLINAQKTPASASDVMGAIAAAYKAVVGSDAPQVALAMLTAQSADETASWKAMWNWNVGNITHSSSDQFDWQQLPGNPLLFRAYRTLDEGATDFVTWHRKNGTLPYADAGDLDGFIAQLQVRCYLGCVPPTDPADYENYKTAIRGLMASLAGVTPTASIARAAVPAWAVGLFGGLAAWVFLSRKG